MQTAPPWGRCAHRLLDDEHIPFGLDSFDLLEQQLETVEFTGDLRLAETCSRRAKPCWPAGRNGRYQARVCSRLSRIALHPLVWPCLASSLLNLTCRSVISVVPESTSARSMVTTLSSSE